MKTSRTALAALGVVAATTMVLTGCSSGGKSGSGAGSGSTITVWSAENQPDRIAIQKADIAGFTKATGIQVKLVGIDDTQLGQLVQSNALSGKLPDVMGALSLSDVRTLEDQKLLDTAAAGAVVDKLGKSTFDPSALSLDSDKGQQLAVPDSSWIQMLLYRKDLFTKAGLPVPNTYANIEKAAQTLTKGGQFGITLSTDPKDVFTEQTFESLALGNGCQLVDSSGKITIDSPQCQATWNLYGALAQKYSPSGAQTVDTTRAAYYAGQAAMVDWSSYILGSLAGLDTANLPSCPQCKGDSTWLAKNTGIVSSIAGPNGQPATFGEISGWTMLKGKNTSASEKFVQYMMSTGYTKWLSMSPEGKVPVRAGTPSNPTEYADAWKTLKTGVTSKATLSSVFDAQTIQAIQNAPKTLQRWAIPQGQGNLLGSINTSLVIPKIVGGLGAGSLTAQAAGQQAAQQVTDAQSKLK
jgi:multiple sugar transport system substrate-binding protein